MKRAMFALAGGFALVLAISPMGNAADTTHRASPRVLGFDCKEGPTPETPGTGMAAFFSNAPDEPPSSSDPFVENSSTTIYEQYGYAGLTWSTYDLGCGPDAARDPGAIVGTAVANWIIQIPIALTAMTGSLTEVAFQPTFLAAFDPVISSVSQTLHHSLFQTWVPVVLAVLGAAIIFGARRTALASTAAAVGWALLVVLLATALIRWPVHAGHLADETVTSTLGATVSQLDGHDSETVDPGTAVASNVVSSIFYRSWLAGTLGSTDSASARKYGPELFKAHALTWREAAILENDPDRGEQIVEDKKQRWEDVTERIKSEDPQAYEHLTGKKSETRVGYAFLTAIGVLLALPFLLISALLLLGCFMIVRLAVMMFPAFATLGAFPAARGLVIGLGRTVGAAVVNAILFGIGAGVLVAMLGLLFNPGGGAPSWLGLVFMPLFSFIMWVALRPFRRLTQMVRPHDGHFANMAGAAGDAGRSTGRFVKKAGVVAAGAFVGGTAGAAATKAMDDDDPPHRAESESSTEPASGGPAEGTTRSAGPPPSSSATRTGGPEDPPMVEHFVPRPTSESAPAPPTEPEWIDGEEVYAIYRPDTRTSEDSDA